MTDAAAEAILSLFFLFNYYVILPFFSWWRDCALDSFFRRQ